MELSELAAMADAYAEVRDQRLELDRQSAKLKETETEYKATLMEALRTQKVGGVAGKKYRVTLRSKIVPQANDWNALYEYIKETGAFELLQKRLSPPAVVERWEDGKNVPGVMEVSVEDLSLNKL